MKMTCVRCNSPVNTNRKLCLACTPDWVWCPNKQHLVPRWNNSKRVSMSCLPCLSEYQRRRRGLPDLSCSFPGCTATFGGKWTQRKLSDPLCPEHRLTHRWCRGCGRLLLASEFPGKAVFCTDTCIVPEMARRQVARKTAVLTAYSVGDSLGCSCCGEDYLAHLSIQHINGDGHLRRVGKSNSNLDSYTHLAALLRKGVKKDDLVTMCMNCNFALGNTPGVHCPNPAHAAGG